MTASSAPMAGPRLRRYDILWIVGIFILSQAATAGVVVLVMKAATLLPARWDSLPLPQPETSQAALVAAIITAGVILALGGYWLAKRRGIDARNFGLGRVRWYWLLAAVILFVLFNWADGIISDWLDPTGQLREDMTQGFFPMHQSLIWAVAVAVAIGPVTAMGEEMMFRGLLYRWLRERVGIMIAALVSAAAFAFVHFYFLSPGGFAGDIMTLEIVVFALLAVTLYQLSGSLWPPILFHALSNGAVVFAAYAPPPMG